MKNGSRLCGTGAARSSTPILQNKAYWEFKLQQAGVWSCGLANPGCDLNKDLGNDLNSWALTHENVVMVNVLLTRLCRLLGYASALSSLLRFIPILTSASF